MAPPAPKPGEGAPPTSSTPKVKKRRLVDVRSLVSGTFIETPEDMETFLKKLRAELESALDADERIQIK